MAINEPDAVLTTVFGPCERGEHSECKQHVVGRVFQYLCDCDCHGEMPPEEFERLVARGMEIFEQVRARYPSPKEATP